MPRKNIEARKEYNKRYNKEYYRKNKLKEKERIRKYKKKIILWWKEYKKGFKCSMCGEDHPSCIEFHHKEKKEKDISGMSWHGYSKKRIRKELEKCISLCSNCHRKIHYKG